MRLVFLASGAFAVPTLRALIEHGHEVALVVSQPARGSGRGRSVTQTPAAQAAVSLGLPLIEIENVNTADCQASMHGLGASLGIVIAFGQKIGAELRGSLPLGFLNLHASLLPKYRGAAPVNWAVIRGESGTGCTVFRIVERMDAGPLFAAYETSIGEEETAGELHDRLAKLGVKTVLEAINCLEANPTNPGMPQDDSMATKAPKLRKSDGVLSFNIEARKFSAHVRGVTPWPGAQAVFSADGDRAESVLLTRVRIAETRDSCESNLMEPGFVDTAGRLRVADGIVQIVEIKPSGGRTMSWADFANGRRLMSPGRFTTPMES